MTDDELRAEFRNRQKSYVELRDEAVFILDKELLRKGIKTHSIPARVKELPSFLDKAKRKDLKDPFSEIHDIVGLRVICLFLSDIPRIRELIRESFAVLSEDDKIEGAEIGSFGYMSLHFNVQMRTEYKGPRYDRIAGMPFEIQVRTILMDAWANVSHYLDYKTDIDVPKVLRRDFYALSGLFYVADSHFELFFKSSKDSREQMRELASTNTPNLALQELNLDSITAYVRTKFADREHVGPKGVSVLLGDLSQAGYTTIQEIDEVMGRAADAFALYEKEHPPSAAKRFADIGVVRVSVGIADDKFFAITSKGHGTPYKERYRSLVKKK